MALGLLILTGANSPALAAATGTADASSTPTPSPTGTPQPTATPSPSGTPSPTATPSHTPTPTPTPKPTPRPAPSPAGPDVASYQHPGGAAINWAGVKKAGESFAFVKASEGAFYDNPYYLADVIAARKAGLVVGAYHFGRPGSPASAAAQARHLVSVAGLGRVDGTLPLVLDLEDSGGLSPAVLRAWTKQFLSTAQALTGRTPIVYTYVSFWRTQMGDDTSFANYPLWEARYASHYDHIGGWTSPTFWQYTSTATLSGVSGAVDRSLYLGSKAALGALSQGSRAGSPTQHISPPASLGRLTAGIRDGQLRAGLTPPFDNGGAKLTGYDAQLVLAGRVVSSWRLSTSGRSLAGKGLTTGRTYQLRVRATNSQGPARWSTLTLPAVATTHLGLTTSTATPGCGQNVVLIAHLSSGGHPLANQILDISASKARGAFTRLGQIRTDRNGNKALRRTVSQSSRFMVAYAASTYRTSARALVGVVCRPTVRLGIAGPLKAGKVFSFSTTSNSGDPTGRGALQMFNGKTWVGLVPIALHRNRGVLRGNGTYTFRGRGTYTVRFVVAGTVGSTAASSKAARIQVR